MLRKGISTIYIWFLFLFATSIFVSSVRGIKNQANSSTATLCQPLIISSKISDLANAIYTYLSINDTMVQGYDFQNKKFVCASQDIEFYQYCELGMNSQLINDTMHFKAEIPFIRWNQSSFHIETRYPASQPNDYKNGRIDIRPCQDLDVTNQTFKPTPTTLNPANVSSCTFQNITNGTSSKPANKDNSIRSWTDGELAGLFFGGIFVGIIIAWVIHYFYMKYKKPPAHAPEPNLANGQDINQNGGDHDAKQGENYAPLRLGEADSDS